MVGPEGGFGASLSVVADGLLYMAIKGLGGMGEGQILDLAGRRAAAIQEAEVDLIRIAYQWALIHSPDRLDPEQAGKPGREKAKPYGGQGTPEVCEFAAAELGARIGRSTFAATQLMADALDLHHRLPLHWAGVEAGTIRSSYARHVALRTRALSAEEAAYVDAAVAPSADGRIPWTRFEALVEAKVKQAAPEAARAREEQSRRATFAKKLRSSQDGMGGYLVRAPIPVIEHIDATVQGYSAAIAEDHPDLSDDERDVEAVRLLLTPSVDQPGRPDAEGCAEDEAEDEAEGDQDGKPAPVKPVTPFDTAPVAHLYLHGYLGPCERDGEGNLLEPMYRLEGHGMLTETYVRDVLGPLCRFKVHPVIDIEGQAPVDSYEIPDRHRQAVHLMTPADVFPFSPNLSRKKHVDHTIPYGTEGGVTGIGNYGPMTLTHHRIKTHGPWTVKQPFPGIYLWRDAHGATYLVDHTGTRQVPQPKDRKGKRAKRTRYIEIYRNLPQIDVDRDVA